MAIRRPHFSHLHRPNVHNIKVHMGHWVHDPRFWAIVGIVVLSALLILSVVLARPAPSNGAPAWPMYPHYYPFAP